MTFSFRCNSSGANSSWLANVSCYLPDTFSKPTSVVESNILTTTATIHWTEIGIATQWEVLVLPAIASCPSLTSSGTIS